MLLVYIVEYMGWIGGDDGEERRVLMVLILLCQRASLEEQWMRPCIVHYTESTRDITHQWEAKVMLYIEVY